MRGVFTKAIVRPPSGNFAAGLTTAELGTPDYHLALEQHAAYCAALEQCGLQLIKLAADERYPDSCFVEDAAIIFEVLPVEHHTRDSRAGTPLDRGTAPDAPQVIQDLPALTRHAVLALPGALSRRGEIESMRGELAGLFHTIDEIRSPGTVDGGDICEAGRHFFIGTSERTNEAGAHQLAAILTRHGYTSSLVDIRGVSGLLHLKSGLAYLGDKTLVVIEALANREEFRGYDLIQVQRGEEYAANCIDVNGHVLMAAGHSSFAAKLSELGYKTIALQMSEFEKMDGGLSCLSVRW